MVEGLLVQKDVSHCALQCANICVQIRTFRQLAKQAIPAGKKTILLVPPDGTICMNYLFQSTILSIEQAGYNQLIVSISLKVKIYIEAVFKPRMSVQPSSVVFRHKQLD